MTLKQPYGLPDNAWIIKALANKLIWWKSIPPEKIDELESHLILWLIVIVMVIGGIMYIVTDDDSLLRSLDGKDILTIYIKN
ncbi:hypothetical protein IM792_09150 [Mucilaginibacter sp. JRF]|uniref:hypothetical protein n=1 Tax=Mucilaginibacter sp. JRF TaxID=2780088 RepID=UPI001881FF01|nr:hypothetical protein [Mucilaginibacter sp. JRF]MBE9584610.1 hypothetical protein [Mucilaginibacter sp. JRF]